MLPSQKELLTIKNKIQSKDRVFHISPRWSVFFYLRKVVSFDNSEIIRMNND